jgi:GNAT superfamily N-acetyltransferase
MSDRRVVRARPRDGTCSPTELAPLVAALDRSFVTGRGRRGSLAGRYPGLLDETNAGNIHVRRHGGRVIACCAVRRFEWLDDGVIWRGAMVGMVHTAPAWRGRGHAAAVLESAVDALLADGVDFAVLWSGLEGFYERLGWEGHDRGLYGRLRISTDTAPTALPGAPPAADTLARLETLRARWAPRRVVRSAAAWRTVPLPATTVHAVFAGRSAGGIAALVGDDGGNRYVYDLVGDPAALPDLWDVLCAGATTVHVNDAIGTAFHRWLAQHTATEFAAQQLAYWRMLSPRAARASWREWHIPWFDRI